MVVEGRSNASGVVCALYSVSKATFEVRGLLAYARSSNRDTLSVFLATSWGVGVVKIRKSEDRCGLSEGFLIEEGVFIAPACSNDLIVRSLDPLILL